MMKIRAVVQTCSAMEKSAKGILKMPSDPKTMPRKMKMNRAGTPTRSDRRFPRIHAKMTMAAIKSVKEIRISSRNIYLSLYYTIHPRPSSVKIA